ncbi:Uncharacterised protein [Klebsiella pneumoniae]|nr:Uncharacterised protein [Klebsiella pneumoniae]
MLSQTGDDLTGGFHTDISHQQLFFQLFKQIVIDLFATEDPEETGTDILTGAYQAAFQTGKEPFFCRSFLRIRRCRGFIFNQCRVLCFRFGFRETACLFLLRKTLFFGQTHLFSRFGITLFLLLS